MQPDGEACNRSAGDKVLELENISTANKIYTHAQISIEHTPALNGYLGLSVDLCLIFQQEVDHLDVAIVTGHVERSVSQLMTAKTLSYSHVSLIQNAHASLTAILTC